MADVPAWPLTVLISVVSSCLGTALGGLFLWWRHSAVQQEKNDARDAAQAAELRHFREETEKILEKMDQMMNGFGERLEKTSDRQGKLWVTMFGPTEQNGIHGTVKDVVKDLAAVAARVGVMERRLLGP